VIGVLQMKNNIKIQLNNETINIKQYMEDSLGYTARQVKKLLKEKKVTINNRKAYWDNVLKNGDILEIDMKEEVNSSIIPQDLPLEILYEDDWFIAVNKPPFMVVHPTKGTTEGTLANAVMYHYNKSNQAIPLRFLNRLDMNTSGVVVLPKSSKSHSSLNAQMEAGEIKKKYIAVVEGLIQPPKGLIEQPIGKDPLNPIKQAISQQGQYAATIYNTIKGFDCATLVELELLTGRTHQIRVHLNYLGHPIIGDELYGSKSEKIARQALHAKTMVFKHPANGEVIELTANIPLDIENLIEQLA
jgi:23S rRNA pseudouridine1911/1915/1917 synthase